MSKTKGLIFDLDGTLTLTQQFHAQAFGEVFKKHGIDYSTEDDMRYAGQGSHCILPGVFGEHGITITKEQEEQYAQEKKAAYDQIIAREKIKIVPGIKEFLAKMKEQGFKMIVASGNKKDAIEVILKKAAIDQNYFSDIVTNQDVEKSKPAPDIFLKAAEKLGLKTDECIVFEDAINGVTAAKAARIRCIALTTGNPPEKLKEAGAAYIVENYTKITPNMIG